MFIPREASYTRIPAFGKPPYIGELAASLLLSLLFFLGLYVCIFICKLYLSLQLALNSISQPYINNLLLTAANDTQMMGASPHTNVYTTRAL